MTTPQDQIFPAAPGYSLLRFTFIDRKVTVEFARSELQILPIVGWRIVSGVVLPVAVGDLQPNGCVDAILAPNNMVYNTVGKSWRGIDAYCAELIKSWAAWRETHGAKAPPPEIRQPVAGDVVLGGRQTGFFVGDAA